MTILFSIIQNKNKNINTQFFQMIPKLYFNIFYLFRQANYIFIFTNVIC